MRLLSSLSALTLLNLLNSLPSVISAASHNNYELPSTLPNGWVYGCYNISSHLPFCDTSLDISKRVEDLISRLTLTEKFHFLGADVTTVVNNCNCLDGGNARLGIPAYMNLVEVNSAVASACIDKDKCATEFAGPTALAASFNKTVWKKKGEIISDELRAFNNYAWYRGQGPANKMALTGFGPNINIVRDPRFGRNSELPSEDPHLTSTYAIEFVRGMQFGVDGRYLKMIAGLKHYAFYTVETKRESFIPNVTQFDMYDTYLPQYEAAFSETYQQQDGGNAAAVMCSYAGANGVPSCANDFLLNHLVRSAWNRSDALVVTDCGAIQNMENANKYAPKPELAAAATLNGGADIDLGDNYFQGADLGGNSALNTAIKQSLTNETAVNHALTRIFYQRFRTGQFDPLDTQVYTKIGIDHINSADTQAFNLDSTLQSFILLKNEDNTLPLKMNKKIAVIGPHVNSTRDLLEDYAGDEICVGGTYECVPRIEDVFTRMNNGNILVARGVDFDSQDKSGIPAAMSAVSAADQIVLVLGIGNTQEHEAIDRTDIKLPGLQTEFALEVFAAAKQQNKPVVLVLISGGVLGVDELVGPAPAIVQSFYPSVRGAEALFMTLFGQSNRFGKLPVTMYSSKFTSEQDMLNFDMTTAPGRTYRYYTGTPLFKFGYGLSYTNYSVSDCNADMSNSVGESFMVMCNVKNTGGVDGDAVVLVYHSVSDAIRTEIEKLHPVPTETLVSFQRVSLSAGEVAVLEFDMPIERFGLTDEKGNKVLYKGAHNVVFTDGSQLAGSSQTVEMTVSSNKIVVERQQYN